MPRSGVELQDEIRPPRDAGLVHRDGEVNGGAVRHGVVEAEVQQAELAVDEAGVPAEGQDGVDVVPGERPRCLNIDR
jgi:hypothetical protein